MNINIPVVLASGSPRRRELLSQADIRYIVMPSDADESCEKTLPQEYVMELAHTKAADICNKLIIKKETGNLPEELRGICDACGNPTQKESSGENLDAIHFCVLGADTVVALDGKILGKPIDVDDAYNTLHSLSGQTHSVYTGVSLIYYDGSSCHTKTFYEKTDVTFYEMSHEEIMAYIATGDPMDKAGSYGIQTQGGIFVKKIDGDYNNVVGLPLSRVYQELKDIAE